MRKILAAAVLTASCRTPVADTAAVNEFEDSLTICADVKSAANAASEGEPEERFRRVKAREERILDDLIAHSQGSDRAGYERQKVRLAACAYVPASATDQDGAQRRDEEKRRALIEEIASTQSLADLCTIAKRTKLVSQRTTQCQAGLLDTGCQRVAAGTAGSDVEAALLTDYRTALTGCVRSVAGEQAAAAAETFATELKRELDRGGDLEEALLIAACRGGAKLTGDKFDQAPQVDYENACGAVGKYGKSRLAACFRTSMDACEIFISNRGMRLDRLIPKDGTQRDKLLRELYVGIDTAVCAQDPTASLACKTIGAAAEQIVQAVKTGNNDWAHCAGSDQLGACIGSLYGSGGWTNNSGVETAKTTGKTTYRGCCWCYKDYYADDGWFEDTRYRRENWFGVIQAGDVATGNCAFKEKGQFPGDKETSYQGHSTYYRYSDCGKAYVAGDSCHPANGAHKVWSPEQSAWKDVRVP